MYGICKRISDSKAILLSREILNTVSARAPELFDDWEETHTRIATLRSGDQLYFYYCRGPAFEGDDTVENPYQITTAEDLAQLAHLVDRGMSYSGMHFLQMNDLDLSGFENWAPIGTVESEYAFAGIYDEGRAYDLKFKYEWNKAVAWRRRLVWRVIWGDRVQFGD